LLRCIRRLWPRDPHHVRPQEDSENIFQVDETRLERFQKGRRPVETKDVKIKKVKDRMSKEDLQIGGPKRPDKLSVQDVPGKNLQQLQEDLRQMPGDLPYAAYGGQNRDEPTAALCAQTVLDMQRCMVRLWQTISVLYWGSPPRAVRPLMKWLLIIIIIVMSL
jgi:hypothetical protein